MTHNSLTAAESIITSRSALVLPEHLPAHKSEAEGGCGVVGLAASVPVKGKHLLVPMLQMTNRGNGKGGGIAAVGLSPEQMGVSQEILDNAYLILVAYLNSSSRQAVEERYIKPALDLHQAQKIPTLDDYREVKGLEVPPPEVWRYFGRVKPNVLREFTRKNGLEKHAPQKVEDEFIYQNSFNLNREFYATGERRAFVLSHGRNLYVLKIVGYAQDVVRYYRLEDLQAHIWIGHQRYPTKGKVWHPGGSHPFVGLDEALVHNGDFANYYSITEYLAQRNIAPLFLTDTEVSVLLFDLLNRVYDYPLEYLIEALAPTTERDFEMLPEEKKRIYQKIQAAHIHGSPDGPWFFIIARNDRKSGAYQLLGITDTSMLRPQVFALQEGEAQIGIIGSEKQAIDATLRSLQVEDSRFWSRADRYWNARGGSYTDGGAFIFSVTGNGNGTKNLICTDKFSQQITLPRKEKPPAPIELSNGQKASPFSSDLALATDVRRLFEEIKGRLADLDYGAIASLCLDVAKFARKDDRSGTFAVELLTLLLDRVYPLGKKKRSFVLEIIENSLYEIFEVIPALGSAGQSTYRRIGREDRTTLRPPQAGETTLVCKAIGFAAEGTDSISQFVVEAIGPGWKNLIIYALSGQRFIACGLGANMQGVTIDVYGSSGDYLASGLDGACVRMHGNAQDQLANIMKSGKLVVHGDVGQTFMYGAKGGEVYVLGNAAGRPLINATGRPRVVINGTCLDYLAESFMAGDPFQDGGFVIVNGLKYDDDGNLVELDTPYPGGNLFSLASGGAIYIRDPHQKVGEDQLNGGKFTPVTAKDWELIEPYLKENQNLFGITVEQLLTVGGKKMAPSEVYRKIEPVVLRALEPEEMEVARF